MNKAMSFRLFMGFILIPIIGFSQFRIEKNK